MSANALPRRLRKRRRLVGITRNTISLEALYEYTTCMVLLLSTIVIILVFAVSLLFAFLLLQYSIPPRPYSSWYVCGSGLGT